MPDLSALKHSDYPDYIRQLASHVQTLPSHDGDTHGWWCSQPRMMFELLPLIAHPVQFDFPPAQTFRDDVARQLALCRKCTRNYHRAVQQWQLSTSADPPQAAITNHKLASLTQWDLTRLIQPMSNLNAVSSSSLQHAQVVAVRKSRCREAFLESLLSHRICADPRFSAQLADLFKRSSPVRNKEDMEPYFLSVAQIPPGLLTLCFDNSLAVRGWATRIATSFARKHRANTRALHFLLREAARQVSIQPDDNVMPMDGASFFSSRETKALWEGFATLICLMQDDSILLFAERNRISILVNPICLSLHSSHNYIVATAADCLYRLLGAVPFEKLFVEGVMPLDAVLDILIHSFKKSDRELSTMHRLLDLFAPVLASAKKGGQSSVSRLFQKCFDFLYTYCTPKKTRRNFDELSMAISKDGGADLFAAVMKTGISLLNWFYSHCAPNLPFEDTAKIANFIVTALREHRSERAWDLLRTALLTDVFNLIRCLKEENDVKVIGDTFLTKRPLNIALRPEEDAIMEQVINFGNQNGRKQPVAPVMTWVAELWELIKTGKHVDDSDQQKVSTNHEEMKIMLDLHRLIGMVDTFASVNVPASTRSPSEQKHVDRKAIHGRISEVQDTIFARLIVACDSPGKQTWWHQLPFHSTHLLSSARKDVANKTFEAFLKSKKLCDASVAGSHSKLLAHVLKNDSEAAQMLADGCVSCLRMIAALGSSVSLRTYPCFLLWYRVLLESRYVVLLESNNSRASSWALALILNFISAWKIAEQTASPSVFSEVCCRFLSNLRVVWKGFYKLVDPVGGKAMAQVMLEKVIIGLLGMHELQNPITRAAWVHTICSVGYTWKDQELYRVKMTKIVGEHAKKRNLLRLDECKKLADALNLHQVQDLLKRWSADEEKKRENRLLRKPPSIKRETKIDQFFGTPQKAEASSKANVFSAKSLASNMMPKRNTDRWRKPPTAQSVIMQGVRDFSRIAKRDARRVPDTVNLEKKGQQESGLTKMQQVVRDRQLEKEKRLAENRSDDNTSHDTLLGEPLGTDHQGRSAEDALKRSMERSGPERTMQRVSLGRRDMHRDEFERFSIPPHRRRLETRSIEQVYRAVLSMKLTYDLRGDKFGKIEGIAPSHFEDVEEYVQHWEPIIISEFRADVLRSVGEERSYAEQEKSSGGYRSCRALFEVETPVETVGYVQNLSLKHVTEEPNDAARSVIPSREQDFSIRNVQSSDLLLLEITTGKSDAAESENTSVSYALGLVASASKKKGVLSFKLNVTFEGLSVIPGKGQQVRVSKLTSLSTFLRQIEGLWSVSDFPSEILSTILDPQEGWYTYRQVRERTRRPLEKYVKPQLDFVQRMREDKSLNESQSNAVEEVVRSCAPLFRQYHRVEDRAKETHSSITLVQGPPGTGKTSTILAMLSALLFKGLESSKLRRARVTTEDGQMVVRLAPIRILVCAPSNAAVDELMLRVIEKGLLTSSGSYAVPRLVRIGSGTTVEALRKLELKTLSDTDTAKEPLGAGPKASNDQFKKLYAELQSLNSQIGIADKERKKLTAKHGADASLKGDTGKSSESMKQYRELTRLLSTLHEEKRRVNDKLTKERIFSKEGEEARKRESSRIRCNLVNSASLVFCTLSSAGHDSLKKLSVKFDAIVVDESAQCGEPEALIPIANGWGEGGSKGTSTHVVLVGDPKQLPATVISTIPGVKTALGTSLFERICEEPQSPLHLLTTQYRMHPDISAFPNQHFYQGRLLDGPNVTSNSNYRSFHSDARTRFGPISFLDTSHCRGAQELRGSGGSLLNRGEAQLVIAAMVSLFRLYGLSAELTGKMVVLSPYRQQVSLLKKMVNERRELRNAGVEVSTIDGIQGREKSVVFLSTVRNSNSGGIGFVDDSRRINVAITRAKHALIIVGHAETLGRQSELWSSLLAHWKNHSRIFSVPSDFWSFFPESRHNTKVKPVPKLPPPDRLRQLQGDSNIRKPVTNNQMQEVGVPQKIPVRPAFRSAIPPLPNNHPKNMQARVQTEPPIEVHSSPEPGVSPHREEKTHDAMDRRRPPSSGNDNPEVNVSSDDAYGGNKERRVYRRIVTPPAKSRADKPPITSRLGEPATGREGPVPFNNPRSYAPLPNARNNFGTEKYPVQPSTSRNSQGLQPNRTPHDNRNSRPMHGKGPRSNMQRNSGDFDQPKVPNHTFQARESAVGKTERSEERGRLLAQHRNNKRPRQEVNRREQRNNYRGGSRKRSGKRRRGGNGNGNGNASGSRPAGFSLAESQQQFKETRERAKRARH